ncbi:sucrose synthase [candidate division KSB1 bacterium]
MTKFKEFVDRNRKDVYLLLRDYVQLNKSLLVRSEFWKVYEKSSNTSKGNQLKDEDFAKTMRNVEVACIKSPWIYLSIRENSGSWKYVRIFIDEVAVEEIGVSQFLFFQEQIVTDSFKDEDWNLEVDLRPFNRGFPKLKEVKSIGKGVEFLNRHLSMLMFSENNKGYQRLFEFLRVHKYKEQQLMLNDRINSVEELQEALRKAESFLNEQPKNHTYPDVMRPLQELGFEPGWGRTVERISENVELLIDILEAADPENLQRFLGRIPMIFKLVIITPHGYFGQSNVLGLPDTGGQVVYILDQVRALEKEINREIYEQGLTIRPEILIVTRLIPNAGETTCNQKTEKIAGTENVRILRIPFRNRAGNVIQDWISRFHIWSYLEQFAVEAEKEILAELEGKPDVIIGNYSDGNLVATLMSQRLGVTQCNIAHALEKTKYLFSDLYWKNNDSKYHFSIQFTADLISMNSADFIITSTYQEIAGNAEEIGQYESYQSFTMPDLYRVLNGIDIFDPKFNIVSPGSDPDIFFPYTDKRRRITEFHDEINSLIFGDETLEIRGKLKEPEKPILFAMSRLDRVKNITGFLRWYCQDQTIREIANILVIGGKTDSGQTHDDEEKQQIEEMHHLFDKYNLSDTVRWAGLHLEKQFSGEVYRFIADRKGVFVQPATFEAFGLTVIEAMISGLPTFATRYGGPLEIIEHGTSGFHIDPNNGEQTMQIIVDFLKGSKDDPGMWKKISQAGIERVESKYTWENYAHRLMRLSRIYGFWKYVSNLEREETQRYLGMFYRLMYRRLAGTVPA